MALQGISAHGTRVYITPPIDDPVGNDWDADDEIEVKELGDIQLPSLTRNEFDVTSHNRNIDTWIFGVARRQPFTFPLFYNFAILSHKVISALVANNDVNTQMQVGFRVVSPDGRTLIFSGGVRETVGSAPVDGPQNENVTIRPSGNYILNGEEYGD